MTITTETKWSSQVVLVMVVSLLATGCAGTSPPRTPAFVSGPAGTSSWAALSGLSRDSNIIIGLKPGATVPSVDINEISALFVESDDDSIIVRWGIEYSGTGRATSTLTLPRDDVRYVRRRVSVPAAPSGKSTMIGLLIGAAASAVTIGLLCTEENDCPPAMTSLIFVPLGATAGAFIGRGYGRSRTTTRVVTIYQAR